MKTSLYFKIQALGVDKIQSHRVAVPVYNLDTPCVNIIFLEFE
jgi:hypothetical protein